MATLLDQIERPSILDRPSPAPRPALSERLGAERRATAGAEAVVDELAGPRRGGEATLDELLVGAWEGLSACRSVACPVCTGELEPSRSTAGGGCSRCGTRLR